MTLKFNDNKYQYRISQYEKSNRELIDRLEMPSQQLEIKIEAKNEIYRKSTMNIV